MKKKLNFLFLTGLFFLLFASCTQREEQRETLTPMERGAIEPDGMEPAYPPTSQPE